MNYNIINVVATGVTKYDYEQKREINELKNIEEILRDDLGKVSGALEFRELTWNNQKANVKIIKLQENEYKIEYKIENKDQQKIQDWTEIENGGEIGELELGDTVYARLTNVTTLGIKYSKDTASITVNDIGKPEVTVTKGNVTTNSIAVNVTSKDNEAGMPTTPQYKYYIKKTADTNYPSEASYIGTDISLNFTGLLQNTSYDIKVTTTDIAGNEGEGEITNITTGQVPNAGGEGSQIGAITYSNLTWNNAKAGITITKNITENYTIKYTAKNKEGTITVNETEISSGNRVENLNLGDTVTAWLTDGINKGNSASITVNDTTPPSAPTLKITSGTMGSNNMYRSAVTVTITPGTDGQSGILKTTYEVTGSQRVAETEGTSVSITAEGISYITAYTYDKANNKTASQQLTVKIKYNTVPTVGGVTVARVANSTSNLTITATAEDADGDNLTYTLLRGDTANNISEIALTPTSISGNTVIFTDTGLTMAKTYYYKVKASDGSESRISENYGSERTWCEGQYCSGGGYSYPTCSGCSGTGKVNCSGCSGTGKITCTNCKGSGTISTNSKCSPCEGTGIANAGRHDYVLLNHRKQICIHGCVEASYSDWRCSKCGADSISASCSCGSCNRQTQNWNGGYCRVTMTCTTCNGKGTIFTTKSCGTCTSSGKINHSSCSGSGKVSHSSCSGKGYTTSSHNCSHGYWNSHYRCSGHGNNVNQYH